MAETISIDDTGGFAHVVFSRAVESVAEAVTVQREIDLAMRSSRRALLDYRSVGAHSDDVRESMWEWIARADVDAVAIVVDGELTRVRLNMLALSRRAPMRAFLSVDEATLWLLAPTSRRTTRITRIP